MPCCCLNCIHYCCMRSTEKTKTNLHISHHYKNLYLWMKKKVMLSLAEVCELILTIEFSIYSKLWETYNWGWQKTPSGIIEMIPLLAGNHMDPQAIKQISLQSLSDSRCIQPDIRSWKAGPVWVCPLVRLTVCPALFTAQNYQTQHVHKYTESDNCRLQVCSQLHGDWSI